MKELLDVGLEVVLLDPFGLHHQAVVQLAQPLQHARWGLSGRHVAVSAVPYRETFKYTHTQTLTDCLMNTIIQNWIKLCFNKKHRAT